MNFIDRALENSKHMTSDEFLQAMADIYKEPEVWDNLKNYPQFVQDVIYIIDYDTELQMEGMEGFFTDRSGLHYTQTHTALLNCKALVEADILHKAAEIDKESEACGKLFEELEDKTAYHNEYDAFWDLVRDYIACNIISYR